ncbi:MAG TPA: class I SAM-dependent methyltransferase [Bacteroidales bacterium]|nr:class I SAM-dependent methyltransferase [Bacteroidales bacterium]
MSEKKTIKDPVNEGHLTLNILSSANKFNKWIYETVKPFIKGDILEIGSGIGNITQCFIEDRRRLTCSDISDSYCSILKDRFKNSSYLHEVRCIDIIHKDFDNEYADLIGNYDSIIAVNMVEHVENDRLAVQNCGKILRKGGRLVILVPAYQWLYNRFDTELEHFRRYRIEDLKTLVAHAGFRIDSARYFNFIGILGWWFSGSMLRSKNIPECQMSLFEFLVPLIKVTDRIIMNKAGLSIIISGTKE